MEIEEIISENAEIQGKMLPEVIFTQLQDTAREWSRIQLIYESALKQVNTKIEILNNEFKMEHKYNPIEHVTSRIKSPESITKKLKHNGIDVSMENIVNCLNDIAGIRIICSFTSDIYRIAELIAKQSDVTVIKIKDYIQNPKPNGYKSYHMIVSVPVYLSSRAVDVKVEIQIRTIAMDFWASLEHKMYYKFEGNAPEHIRRELKECADLVSFLDSKMLALNEEIRMTAGDTEDEVFEAQIYENETKTALVEDSNQESDPIIITIPEEGIEDDDDMASRLRYMFSGQSKYRK